MRDAELRLLLPLLHDAFIDAGFVKDVTTLQETSFRIFMKGFVANCADRANAITNHGLIEDALGDETNRDILEVREPAPLEWTIRMLEQRIIQILSTWQLVFTLRIHLLPLP